MNFFLIVLFVINSLPTFCMDNSTALLDPLSKYFNEHECPKKEQFLIDFFDNLTFPQTMAPDLLRDTKQIQFFCNPFYDTDLQPNDVVLFAMQLGVFSRHRFTLFDDVRWADYKCRVSKPYDYCVFDGVNKNDMAIVAGQSKNDRHALVYRLYLLRMPVLPTSCVISNPKRALWHGKGEITALMLGHDYNRLAYCVSLKKKNKFIIQDIYSLTNKCYAIAKAFIPMRVVKIVGLSPIDYFGITDEGELYSFWIDNAFHIQYKKQKLPQLNHKFQNIAVDNATISSRWWKTVKIAFLTKEGELYITHLGACSPLTLFYLATIENEADVQRFYYKNRKVFVVYNNTVHVWNDNFEILYARALLKKCIN